MTVEIRPSLEADVAELPVSRALIIRGRAARRLALDPGELGRSEQVIRGVNFVIAAVALVLLAPLMLLVALLVRVTSPGPILHIQTRVGLDRRDRPWRSSETHFDRRMSDLGGRVFTIYKFRSMYVDAESRSGAVWASRHDPRITPIGRYLRKLRIDELPQLFNVLTGDMNIVGPRPERPSIFLELRDSIEDYSLRQRAKPGITGWAQVNQAYDTCLDDVRSKVRYDLEYIRDRHVGRDLRIMLRTIPVMLGRRHGW